MKCQKPGSSCTQQCLDWRPRVSHIHILVVCPLAGFKDSFYLHLSIIHPGSPFLFSLCLFRLSLSFHAPFVSAFCLYSPLCLRVAFILLLFVSDSASPRHGPPYFSASYFLSLHSSIYISYSQAVHGNELSASVRHSQWCGRRAASLSLSLSLLLSL